MIDLHCHILPGIDDGPSSLEEALAMAKIAVANGITHTIVTPHINLGRYDNVRDSISLATTKFAKALEINNINLSLGFAAEVRLSDDIPFLIKNTKVPFYGEYLGFEIMLLEFPHNQIPVGSDKLIEWLLKQNIRPMIAHPERNKAIMKDIKKIKPFIELGCFFQLTAGALDGEFGEPARLTALDILALGCVTVIASDSHNTTKRLPRLDHGRAVVESVLGAEEARRMVLEMPKLLVAKQFSDL